MSDSDWDELIVCPTCRHTYRPDEDDEDAHKQPCPECGWPQMSVSYEVWDEGDVEVTARWNQGEGARLFLGDVQRVIGRANEFLLAEEAEDNRIDEAITEMRAERLQEEEI